MKINFGNCVFILFFSLCIACKEKKPNVPSNLEYSPLLEAISNNSTADTSKVYKDNAVMNFPETVFDFGNIDTTKTVRHKFLFTNNGKSPLMISEAKSSCGCTVPNYPKGLIMPGDTAVAEVSFDPKGKSGMQTKIISFIANTEPPENEITIKANIITK